MVTAADIDNLSPQVSVLGSLLLEPKLIGDTMTKIRAEDFRNSRCRMIYQAITGLFLEGKAVDPVLVCGRLEGIDSIAKDVLSIMDQTPTAANIAYYITLLREQSIVATLRDIGEQLQTAVDLEKSLALVDQAMAVTASRPGPSRMSAQDMVRDFTKRHAEGAHPEYYSWSIPKLDDGLYTERGDMVILGGYSSAGKTALALRFAWHMAATHRVGFYSLETKAQKLADRSMSYLASIDMGAIKRSVLTQADWDKVTAKADSIYGCNLDFVPAGGMTVQDIRADALAHHYEVIYVDYLQLITPPNLRANRTEVVTSISIELHQMAQGNDITVVALSQLRRAENTKGKEESAPDMHSLRESGQLEQDADTIMLLYRENPDAPDSRRILKVAKNKEGVIGKIYLDFDGATQTFRQSQPTTGEKFRTLQKAIKEAGEKTPHQVSFQELQGEDPDLPF